MYNPRTSEPATDAQRAMWLSVRISDRLRSIIGTGGDSQALWSQLHTLFPDVTERTEAGRLLELAGRIRKRRPEFDALSQAAPEVRDMWDDQP